MTYQRNEHAALSGQGPANGAAGGRPEAACKGHQGEAKAVASQAANYEDASSTEGSQAGDDARAREQQNDEPSIPSLSTVTGLEDANISIQTPQEFTIHTKSNQPTHFRWRGVFRCCTRHQPLARKANGQ